MWRLTRFGMAGSLASGVDGADGERNRGDAPGADAPARDPRPGIRNRTLSL